MKIIKTTINEDDKKAMYNLTLAPNRGRMTDHKGENMIVTDFILYEDVKRDGIDVTMLSICLGDGSVLSTVSESFIREFAKIEELFGMPVAIQILSGTSKNGREFVYCTLGDE